MRVEEDISNVGIPGYVRARTGIYYWIVCKYYVCIVCMVGTKTTTNGPGAERLVM